MTREQPTVRVLHVLHGLGRGGLENGVINLLNYLPEAEFEQAVCCLDQKGEMANRIVNDVAVSVMDRKRHDFVLPFRLAKLIRTWRPDVIHCRGWNTWFDSVAAHRLSGGASSLAWSFHGFTDSEPFPLRRRLISRGLAALTPHLFAVSRDAAQRFASQSRIADTRFQVLYNGVDTVKFQPVADKRPLRAKLGLPQDATIALTVASLTPIKDHCGLLQAIAGLSLGTNAPVCFVLIGSGPLKAQLENQAAEQGVAEYVHFLGEQDRVADYLAAADFFILPSRLEGMSNAILEAMASGLPVIARDVGGNPELVNAGETGLLCKPGDPDDLAHAIRRLFEDGALRTQMGQKAREHAVATFSIEAMMMAYAAFYRLIAGK